MGVGDKLSAGLDKLKGKAEEAVGKATGDEKLVAEGRADQIKAEVKDAAHDVGEHIKDAIDDRRNR